MIYCELQRAQATTVPIVREGVETESEKMVQSVEWGVRGKG